MEKPTKGDGVVADRIGQAQKKTASGSAGISPVRPVRERAQLSEEISEYVRELIMSGQLRSGEPLNIDALARELQTSATPVREGLLMLQGQGFVQMEPRRGFRITPLTRQDIADMFLVQGLIAGELTARCAREASGPLLEEITSLQERMRQADARSDGEEMETLNFQFHRLINRAVPSPKLTWLMSVVVRYVPRLFYASISGWRDASLRDHEAIIESLRARDPEGARQAMISHIRHAGELLVSHLENEGFWSTATEGIGQP